MRRFAHGLSYVVIATLGWIGGSVYPAPPTLIARISPQSLAARVRGDLESIQHARGMNWASIQSLFGPDQARRLSDDVLRAAQQAGTAIKVEHAVDQATKEAEQQFSVPPPVNPSLTQTASITLGTPNPLTIPRPTQS